MTTELVGERHERAELSVIPPAVSREEAGESGPESDPSDERSVDARRPDDGNAIGDRAGAARVGAVAYPYCIYEAEVTIPRRFTDDRTERYVASVDRSRRLALRADAVPAVETRTVEDALVLPAELSEEASRERARESVLQWTLRRFSLSTPPDIEFVSDAVGYKLFWLVERPDGDVIVDSVRGTEDPL